MSDSLFDALPADVREAHETVYAWPREQDAAKLWAAARLLAVYAVEVQKQLQPQTSGPEWRETGSGYGNF